VTISTRANQSPSLIYSVFKMSDFGARLFEALVHKCVLWEWLASGYATD